MWNLQLESATWKVCQKRVLEWSRSKITPHEIQWNNMWQTQAWSTSKKEYGILKWTLLYITYRQFSNHDHIYEDVKASNIDRPSQRMLGGDTWWRLGIQSHHPAPPGKPRHVKGWPLTGRSHLKLTDEDESWVWTNQPFVNIGLVMAEKTMANTR